MPELIIGVSDMNKDDLKSGMFVTTRNNRTYMVLKDAYLYGFHEKTGDYLINIDTGKFLYLQNYTNDLFSRDTLDEDIICVYRMDYFGNIFISNPEGHLVWERE